MSQKKRIKIVVGVNSLTESQYPAYTNHCQLWYSWGRSKALQHIDFCYVNPARMPIDRMRNMAAEVALDIGADYLLFLDDDVIIQTQTFESTLKNPLVKLLECKADAAGGKVVIRGYPFDWMVFKYPDGDKKKGLVAQSEVPDTGIEPCDALGFSFTLIKTKVFKNLTKPYFVTGLTNTEDIYFFVKARQVNLRLKVVVDCSILCGHILWPEIMDARNREAYKRYFEEMNPAVLEYAQKKKLADEGKGDRGESYLEEVKETVDGILSA